MSDLFHLLHEGSIKPLIGNVFTLDQVRQAHELLQEGKVQGQLVVVNSLI